MTAPVFVGGAPALFLTAGEKAWTQRVREAIAEDTAHPSLAFRVASSRRRGNPFDIDNLTKPVLELASRSPVTVWTQLEIGEPEGVMISEAVPPEPARVDVQIDVATIRRSSIRPLVPLSETSAMPVLGDPSDDLGLDIAYHDANENLGDFGFSGPVKPLIDGLIRLLGGEGSAPHDHRIRDLRLRKSPRPHARGATIRMWVIRPLPRQAAAGLG